MRLAFGYTLSSCIWTLFSTSILTILILSLRKRIILLHHGILLKTLTAMVMIVSMLPIYYIKSLFGVIEQFPSLRPSLLYRIDYHIRDMWYENVHIDYQAIGAGLIIAIILIVAIYFCIRDYKVYYALFYRIRRLKPKTNEHVLQITNAVRLKLNIKIELPVLAHKQINIPSIGGFIKPIIFLPDRPWTDKELYYIFEHEYRHYRHGDAWLKFFLLLIKNINWWNYFLHLLFNCFEQACGHHVDYKVTKDQPLAYRKDYARSIVRAIKFSQKEKTNSFGTPMGFSTFALPKNNAFTEERLYLFLERMPKVKSWLLTMILIGCSLLLPITAFAYIPYEEEGIAVESSSGDYDYFVDKNDGTYDYYVDGAFQYNVIGTRSEIEAMCHLIIFSTRFQASKL